MLYLTNAFAKETNIGKQISIIFRISGLREIYTYKVTIYMILFFGVIFNSHFDKIELSHSRSCFHFCKIAKITCSSYLPHLFFLRGILRVLPDDESFLSTKVFMYYST